MERTAKSFVPGRKRFTRFSVRAGSVTGPVEVLMRLLGLSALLILALAPLETSANSVSIQILDPVRNDPDTPPGAGTIVDESLFVADGPVAPLSFDDDIFNSPTGSMGCCAGALAGSARVLAEVDLSTSTLRAGAELSLNDPTQSGRRTGTYFARAAADFSQDYDVSSSNPDPPATTDILVGGNISGTIRTSALFLDSALMSAAVGAFDELLFFVTCSADTQTQDCDLSDPAPDVVIVQDAVDPSLWNVSGTFSTTVQAPVNQVSRFGAFLLVSVLASTETQTASDFSDSLILSLTSTDPDITVTPVPEPAGALQIAAALVTLAMVGSARRARRRI